MLLHSSNRQATEICHTFSLIVSTITGQLALCRIVFIAGLHDRNSRGPNSSQEAVHGSQRIVDLLNTDQATSTQDWEDAVHMRAATVS